MKRIIDIILRNRVAAGTAQNSTLCLPINRWIMKVFNTPLSLHDHLSVQTDGKKIEVTLAGWDTVIKEDMEEDIAERLLAYLNGGRLMEAVSLTRKRLL